MNVGWAWTGLILGVIACVLVLIPGLTIQEKIGMEEPAVAAKKPEASFKEQLPAVVKNRYFWTCLIVGALVLFMNANAIASMVYYCNVVLQDPSYMTMLMSIGQFPGIVVLLFMPWFSKHFSKRAFMATGAAFLIVGFALVGLAGTSSTMLLIGTIFPFYWNRPNVCRPFTRRS